MYNQAWQTVNVYIFCLHKAHMLFDMCIYQNTSICASNFVTLKTVASVFVGQIISPSPLICGCWCLEMVSTAQSFNLKILSLIYGTSWPNIQCKKSGCVKRHTFIYNTWAWCCIICNFVQMLYYKTILLSLFFFGYPHDHD